MMAACSASDEGRPGATAPATAISGVDTRPPDCEDTSLAVLDQFFTRYSAGDAGSAAELFAPEPSFEWFTHDQGRLNADEDPWSPYDRDTLVEFFQARHDAGETIELQGVSDGRVSLGDRHAALAIRFELEGDAFDGIGGVVVQCDTGLIRVMSIGRAPLE
jgi:hypothetical protein